MKVKRNLVLASASPRRRELLRHLTTDFQVQSADIDETPLPHEPPESLVRRLAEQKARHIALQAAPQYVLGSDTVVAIDALVLGKPRDEKDFLGMMASLSGTWHDVYTAVCLVHNGSSNTVAVKTKVEFTALNQAEMKQYWETGEPCDKAGGYAIQGIGGQFVKQIHGSVSAVIGLPLLETKHLLQASGIIL